MKHPIFILVAIPFLLMACNAEPTPIAYGTDECHWCHMRIMDPRFGAEAVTDKGRIYKFDSGECLLRYLQHNSVRHRHLLVTDYSSPEVLIDAQQATYLISESMPSPMGGFLNAFRDGKVALAQQQEHGGEVYNWHQIQIAFAP